MKRKNITYILILIVIAVIIGIFEYSMMKSKSIAIPTVDQTQTNEPEISVVYKNTVYGFDFTLPISWKGYSIVEDKWTGQRLDTQGTTESSAQIEGPKILIRHPLWTKEIPRQDIPIMIFTPAQWSLIEEENLSVGAAPIGPNLLGRNNEYVFALPARYNFAYQVGFEEVQKIIESKALHTF